MLGKVRPEERGSRGLFPEQRKGWKSFPKSCEARAEEGGPRVSLPERIFSVYRGAHSEGWASSGWGLSPRIPRKARALHGKLPGAALGQSLTLDP